LKNEPLSNIELIKFKKNLINFENANNINENEIMERKINDYKNYIINHIGDTHTPERKNF
jgi:hypothetical protein